MFQSNFFSFSTRNTKKKLSSFQRLSTTAWTTNSLSPLPHYPYHCFLCSDSGFYNRFGAFQNSATISGGSDSSSSSGSVACRGDNGFCFTNNCKIWWENRGKNCAERKCTGCRRRKFARFARLNLRESFFAWSLVATDFDRENILKMFIIKA